MSLVLSNVKAHSPTAPVTAVTVGHRHIRALDGIRGAAILLVLLHHLGRSLGGEFGVMGKLQRASEFGWVGVDLFFVLSGFLITGILYDNKESPRYFRNFYMRRALRIFPLYFSALLFLLVLRAAWPNLGLYGTASDGWMWLYLTNVVIAVQGYGAFGLMDHFWSLAIEEHFYLVWPFVVFALDRRAALWVAFGMCVVALSLRVAFAMATDNVAAIYTLSPLRMDSLAVGALLALAIRGPGAIQLSCLVRPALWVACANSIILAGVLWITRDYTAHNPLMQTVGYTLIATLFGALIVLGLESWPRRVFELGLLRWFGKYSYGIYVWHPILWVIVFHSDWARALRQGNGPQEMLLSLGVAIVVVWVFVAASWYLLESQFLKLKNLYQ